jgi:hypothetical protein
MSEFLLNLICSQEIVIPEPIAPEQFFPYIAMSGYWENQNSG